MKKNTLKKFNKVNYPALKEIFISVAIHFICFVFTLIGAFFIVKAFVGSANLSQVNKIVFVSLCVFGLIIVFTGLSILNYFYFCKRLTKTSETMLKPVITEKENSLSKYSKIDNEDLIQKTKELAKAGQPYVNVLFLICFIMLTATVLFLAILLASMQQFIASLIVIIIACPIYIVFPIYMSKQNKQIAPFNNFMNLEEEYKGNLAASFTINNIDIVNLKTKNTSGLNLKINEYQTIYIYTDNEDEKETLADTLSFFVKPIEGQIYVNGKNTIQIFKEELLEKSCVLDSNEFKELINSSELLTEENKPKVEYAKFKVSAGYDKVKDAKNENELISAVFKNADIYILNSIFDKFKETDYLAAVRAMEEMLPDKIFIILTSKVYNYADSNKVIVYKNGKVVANDNFANVVNTVSEFAKYKKEEPKKQTKK